MIKTVIQFAILLAVLLIAQVLCSKIVLFGVATPLIFIYFILRLPINFSVNWTLTIAFLMGLIVDTFNNTQGMNALSCTLLAAARKPTYEALFIRDEDDETGNPIPSISSLGLGGYLKYMTTLVVLYCMVVFLIQAFTFHNLGLTLLRIVCSSLLTCAAILAIDSLVSTSREKRL